MVYNGAPCPTKSDPRDAPSENQQLKLFASLSDRGSIRRKILSDLCDCSNANDDQYRRKMKKEERKRGKMVQPPEKVCYVFYTNYKKAR